MLTAVNTYNRRKRTAKIDFASCLQKLNKDILCLTTLTVSLVQAKQVPNRDYSRLFDTF
jgi:hypothetical protein